MTRNWKSLGALTLALAGAALAAPAQESRDWPNWRGPNFNGSSSETGLPVKFSPTEGVRWSTPLPGPSAATPAIWGDRVFVSSADAQNQKLLALCLDRKSGAVRWQHEAGTGYQPGGKGTPTFLDYRSNYASPSPVTDGKRVIFFYGNGDLTCFDPDGKKLWARNLQQDYGDFCFGWTFSSTPQIYDGRLYVQILQRDFAVAGRGKDGSESYLIALNPATGQELWKVSRPTPARMESREAFTTPIPVEDGDRKEIVLAGGDLLTGHDPATGKEKWRWGTFNVAHRNGAYRLVPSPVAGGGVILICGPKREPVFAIKGGLTGEHAETGIQWRSADRSEVTSDVPTPLFYRGKFYVLSDLRKAISCIEPSDGRILWTTALAGTAMCWASPTGADGKLYLMSLRGEVYVLEAATGQILSTNPMAPEENEIRSSIAVAWGSLFIRTNTRLYCVGQ